MTESKYIIVRKYGKLKHYKFPASWHHFWYARDNGYDFYRDVVETGLIVDKKIKILECKVKEHIQKKEFLTVLSEQTMKAREVESRYMYKSKGVYELKDGD